MIINKEFLEYAQKLYPPGTWIMPITPNDYINEPMLVKGRLESSEHYYGICHQDMGAIWTKKGWAKIVERPLTSTLYKL